MMKADLKQRWVAALLSGDYQQGHTMLRYETPNGITTYCCLGVLMDVIDPAGWEPLGSLGYRPYLHRLAASLTQINDPVTVAGLSVSEQRHLITLNDELNMIFLEIADYIEEHL